MPQKGQKLNGRAKNIGTTISEYHYLLAQEFELDWDDALERGIEEKAQDIILLRREGRIKTDPLPPIEQLRGKATAT